MTAIADRLAARLAELDLGQLVADKLVVAALPGHSGLPQCLSEAGARDVLILGRGAPASAERHADHVSLRYSKARNVHENNCHVAILHGPSSLALATVKALARFETLLVPIGVELAVALMALSRFRRRDRLAIVGRTKIDAGGKARSYLVLKSSVRSDDHRRQYATAGLAPIDVVRRLEGLDYVVLRWPDTLEAGTHEGDIDLLVSAQSADSIRQRFSGRVSTIPLDVYTDDGSGGYYFNQVPYFLPSMARRILDSATTSPAGVRVASPQWQFLSFAYHLLFHVKSRRVRPGTTHIGPDTFRGSKYFHELQRLAAAASEKPPQTFDDIEAALRRANAFPGIDLIGFYSKKNRFLQQRYFGGRGPQPGLATVFVRDFGRGMQPVDDIRATLADRFIIVAEGPVNDAIRDRLIQGVRGGNWNDPEAPGGKAEPVYWFVCWDKRPRRPSRKMRRKYPHVDNENLWVKHEIRDRIGERRRKAQRLVHSSDNTAEALEHLDCLGLSEHPKIVALKLRATEHASGDPR